MDTAAFATWLGGIGLLDPAQRAEAFRELALAEADDPIDPSAHPVDAAVLPYEAAVAPSLPVAETEDAAPEEDLLSKVGRGRIARFGCPHCGRDDVRPWGNAGGKPRYRCKSCRKTFNPLTGTPLAGLHHQDRWPDQAQALIAGAPARPKSVSKILSLGVIRRPIAPQARGRFDPIASCSIASCSREPLQGKVEGTTCRWKSRFSIMATSSSSRASSCLGAIAAALGACRRSAF